MNRVPRSIQPSTSNLEGQTEKENHSMAKTQDSANANGQPKSNRSPDPVTEVSIDDGLQVHGRFHAGDALSTTLPTPVEVSDDNFLWIAAKMPVPPELMIELRSEAEDFRHTQYSLAEKAVQIANRHVIAAGLAGAYAMIADGRTVNSTATLIAATLYMRVLAFEEALRDAQFSRMLIHLHQLGRVSEVFKVAAIAPLDPGIGDIPRYLPVFRVGIEDLAVRS